MEWGSKMEMLLKMKEQGQDPPALRNRPKLLERLEWYYECFTDMGTDRSYTEGQALSLTTGQIHTYWKVYDLHNFENFIGKIKLIDRIWINKSREKSKKESEQKTAPTGSQPPMLKSG